jgi:cytochrome c553
MRPLTIAALASTLLLAIAGVQAQQPAPTGAPTAAPSAAPAAAPAAPKGDAARGKELAYTCKGCHGVGGYRNVYPHYHVPRIVGQSDAYLKAALMGYRDGSRKHPTMQAQAQSFSEKDIADLAAYLASLK